MIIKINSVKVFNKLPSVLVNLFTIKTGYIPNTPSADDPLFSSSGMASQSITAEIDLSCYFKEVSDQYYLSACVANAVADAFEAQIAHKNKIEPSTVKDLSRLFIYWNARNLATPPITTIDDGSHIKWAFDSIKRYGVPNEEDYPYVPAKVNDKPGWLIYKKAIQHKITGFYRISSTGDNRILNIKQALSARNPVVFGTAIAESFRKINNDTIVNLPSDKYIGNHAMIIVGWSDYKKAFKIRNSWGTSFGINGYCYMSPEYIKSNITSDIWAATI